MSLLQIKKHKLKSARNFHDLLRDYLRREGAGFAEESDDDLFGY